MAAAFSTISCNRRLPRDQKVRARSLSISRWKPLPTHWVRYYVNLAAKHRGYPLFELLQLILVVENPARKSVTQADRNIDVGGLSFAACGGTENG